MKLIDYIQVKNNYNKYVVSQYLTNEYFSQITSDIVIISNFANKTIGIQMYHGIYFCTLDCVSMHMFMPFFLAYK